MTDLYAYSMPTDSPDTDSAHMFSYRGMLWWLTTEPLPRPLFGGMAERTLAEYEAALDAAKAAGMRRGWADHREGVPTIPVRFSDRLKEFLTDVGTDLARLLPR